MIMVMVSKHPTDSYRPPQMKTREAECLIQVLPQTTKQPCIYLTNFKFTNQRKMINTISTSGITKSWQWESL